MVNFSNITIKIGLEIEFYIKNYNEKYLVNFKNELEKFDIYIFEEQGDNQFEFQIPHSSDLKYIAKTACKAKEKIQATAIDFNMIADFSAKPYMNQPGNAMQVNISIYDENNGNIFKKDNEQESIYLLHAIGGLCKDMKNSMHIFAPNENDYLRYHGDNFSPSTISWGGNNRTTAIRVPTTCSVNRRIEHRVPSANAHPYKVIIQIVKSVVRGIKDKITPPEKIYGNANNTQYLLEKLPTSLEV
jgi:glutamine synthetase